MWTGSKTYRYLVDNGYGTYKGCVGRSYPIRIDDLEDLVFEEMKKRLETIEIARRDKESVDPEAESIKAEIIEIDGEIRSLMDKMAKADDVVFAYIQQRIKEQHSRKSEFERKLQTKSRKHKAINTKPLTEPLAMWDTLTVQEKHDVAAEMIEGVYISHLSEDIEIKFGI